MPNAMPDKRSDKTTDKMPDSSPTTVSTSQPTTVDPRAMQADTSATQGVTAPPADQTVLKAMKYRFWLSLFALFMSAIFGALALLGVAAGYGLANDMNAGDPRELVFTFKVMTGILITLAPTCIWTAYKLRPGGD